LLHQLSKQRDLNDKEEKMIANRLARTVSLVAVIPMILTAQMRRSPDPVALKYWAAPLYWQPRSAEATVSLPANANPLVFVAMTPCRIADTRASQNFPAPFGPSPLVAGASRTFPVQSSTLCSIPSAAQAYSMNITVVPAGPTGFLTAFPSGQSLPLAATLVWSAGSVTSNAAIVPAGTNGSIDIYANDSTDMVIDINGYYGAVADNNNGNTALGASALAVNAGGYGDSAFGIDALKANTTGSYNTGVGLSALPDNTTGNRNVAIGAAALDQNTTGSYNIAIGVQALQENTTGNNNIAIGYSAGLFTGFTFLGSSNNIDIGNMGVGTDSNTIRIGDPGTHTRFFAAGIRGVATGNNDAVPVVVDSNGQIGTVSSSRRFKEDIQDMGKASRGLMQLRPVTFRYQKPFADGTKPIQYGLVAEEVAEIYPDLVAHSADGQIETVKYQVLDSMLLNEMQRQQRMIEQQMHEIEALKAQLSGLSALESRLLALESAVARNH
jgi:hypothetical protein